MDVFSAGGTKRKADVVHRIKRRVGKAGLAEALGAEEVARIPSAADTPAGFVALRTEVFRLLRSGGGSPGVPDADRRKIPVTDAAWIAVSLAARNMAAPGFAPTPAQVASAIFDIALRDMPRFAERAELELRQALDRRPANGAD